MKLYKLIFLLLVMGASYFIVASEVDRTITLNYETNIFVDYVEKSDFSKLLLSQMELSGSVFVRREILASINIETLGVDEDFSWSDCYFDSNSESFDPTETPIIGVLKFDQPLEPSKPERTWLVNYKEKTLKVIDPNTVLCIHDIP